MVGAVPAHRRDFGSIHTRAMAICICLNESYADMPSPGTGPPDPPASKAPSACFWPDSGL